MSLLVWGSVAVVVLCFFVWLWRWTGELERMAISEAEWSDFLGWCRAHDPHQAMQWELVRRR